MSSFSCILYLFLFVSYAYFILALDYSISHIKQINLPWVYPYYFQISPYLSIYSKTFFHLPTAGFYQSSHWNLIKAQTSSILLNQMANSFDFSSPDLSTTWISPSWGCCFPWVFGPHTYLFSLCTLYVHFIYLFLLQDFSLFSDL